MVHLVGHEGCKLGRMEGDNDEHAGLVCFRDTYGYKSTILGTNQPAFQLAEPLTAFKI